MAAATAPLASFETGHGDMVHDAEFDYYGKRLATCSSDRYIKIFEVVGEQVSVGWGDTRRGAAAAAAGRGAPPRRRAAVVALAAGFPFCFSLSWYSTSTACILHHAPACPACCTCLPAGVPPG